MAVSGPLVCFGDNCLDLYVAPVDQIFVGGSCLNVAVGLAREGVPAAYVGAVGDDASGRAVLSALARAGVDRSHVQVVANTPTALTEIVLEEGGERHFLRERYAIYEDYAPSADDWAFLAQARHIHASRLPRYVDRLLSLGEAGARVSYDFSVDPLPARLEGLEVVFVPHDRLPPGAEPFASAHELVERGCTCAVVTLGGEGSLASSATETAVTPAVPLDSVVDTCGAGDAFIASFIAANLAGESLQVCLEKGAAAGGAACTMLGAFPQTALPDPALK
jgi:fructoselysine 6-kinase